MINLILPAIRIARLKKNLSQQNVALKLNFTQSYYAKIESGKADITVCNFLKLLEILDLDFFEFSKKIKKLSK